MSVAPTSAAEAGWTEADEAWERLQAEAAAAAAGSDDATAGERWAQALRLARAAFPADDPRLATSLVNHALDLRRRGDRAADRLLAQALGIWERAPAWLARQAFARRARSSLFHLRLEAKHPGAYDTNQRRHALALLRDAREVTAALAAGAASEAPDPAALQAIWSAPRDARRRVQAAARLLAARVAHEHPERSAQEGS